MSIDFGNEFMKIAIVKVSTIYRHFSLDTYYIYICKVILSLSILTAMFIEAKDDGDGGDNWSYKSCKASVISPPTNQHPVFYRPDALPVAQPTVSKHYGENITFHGLAYPKLTWGSSNFVSDH